MKFSKVIEAVKYLDKWFVWDVMERERDDNTEPIQVRGGFNTLLDILTNNADKCHIIYSDKEIPESYVKVLKLKGPGLNKGIIYTYDMRIADKKFKHKVWVPLQLLEDFDKVPKHIYFKIFKI